MDIDNTTREETENYISFGGSEKVSYQAILHHTDILTKMEKEIKTNMNLSVDQLKDLLNQVWTNYESIFEHLKEILRTSDNEKNKDFLTNQLQCYKEQYKITRDE